MANQQPNPASLPPQGSGVGRVDVAIRWITRSDIREAIEIDQECFGARAWTERELLDIARSQNTITMVATAGDGPVLGFMSYELLPRRINLVKLAVGWSFQRRGVGTALIDKLKSKLRPRSRRAIEVVVPDSNLDAHLFLSTQGFKAVDVIEDIYVFEFRV